MWELTKRKSLRISSVLSKVEPEPGAGPLHRLWLRLRPKVSGSDWLPLRNTESDTNWNHARIRTNKWGTHPSPRKEVQGWFRKSFAHLIFWSHEMSLYKCFEAEAFLVGVMEFYYLKTFRAGAAWVGLHKMLGFFRKYQYLGPEFVRW